MIVMLVEDEPLIANAVTAAVNGAGHQCTWIADGAVAIHDDSVMASDLVVLDLMLPGADGLDVLRTARARGVRTPVIVLTARGTTADKLEVFAAGADDRVRPPQPILTAQIASRVDLVHPVSKEAGHGSAGGSAEVGCVGAAAAAV